MCRRRDERERISRDQRRVALGRLVRRNVRRHRVEPHFLQSRRVELALAARREKLAIRERQIRGWYAQSHPSPLEQRVHRDATEFGVLRRYRLTNEREVVVLQ